MAFKSFQEYLTDSGKMVEKPQVKVVAGYEGKIPESPENSKKDPSAGGAKDSKNGHKPYKAGSDAKNPNKAEKGFAHEGDSDLKYEPETSVKKTNHGGEEVKSWLDSSSVTEWLNKTKNLSNAKFVNQMRENTVGLAVNEVKNVVQLCVENEKNIQQFVFELKRSNILEQFVSELLKHESAIKQAIVTVNESTLGKKVLSEMNYMSSDDEFDSEDSEDDMVDLDMDDEDMDDDSEDEDMDDEDMGDDSEDEDMDDEDMDDEDMDDDSEGEDMDYKGTEGEDGIDDEEIPHEEDDTALSDSFGKRHAHHALKKMSSPPRPSDEI